jgi:hypothetical protein
MTDKDFQHWASKFIDNLGNRQQIKDSIGICFKHLKRILEIQHLETNFADCTQMFIESIIPQTVVTILDYGPVKLTLALKLHELLEKSSILLPIYISKGMFIAMESVSKMFYIKNDRISEFIETNKAIEDSL